MTDNSDAPGWLLDYFRLEAGTVRWATKQELEDEPPTRRRRTGVPYGQPAGGRNVVGYGRLVTCSGRALLTADIAAAIRDGVQWPWDAAAPYKPAGSTALAGDLDDAIAEIRANWLLRDGSLRWNVDAHSTLPRGSEAIGTKLPGREDFLLNRYGLSVLRSEVVFVLCRGRFPWQPDWD